MAELDICDECKEIVRYYNDEMGNGLASCACCVEGDESLAGKAKCPCGDVLLIGQVTLCADCALASIGDLLDRVKLEKRDRRKDVEHLTDRMLVYSKAWRAVRDWVRDIDYSRGSETEIGKYMDSQMAASPPEDGFVLLPDDAAIILRANGSFEGPIPRHEEDDVIDELSPTWIVGMVACLLSPKAETQYRQLCDWFRDAAGEDDGEHAAH